MGKAFTQIDLNRAKTISHKWKVTEASALLYFQDKKWTRKAISAEVEEAGNEIVFHLKGGDFVTLEKGVTIP